MLMIKIISNNDNVIIIAKPSGSIAALLVNIVIEPSVRPCFLELEGQQGDGVATEGGRQGGREACVPIPSPNQDPPQVPESCRSVCLFRSIMCVCVWICAYECRCP